MFLTFDPDIFYYHNILSGEEQYFFGKACYTMTAYVKIRQILCAFEEGKVTKKTKTGGYFYMKKKKWELAAMTAVTAFLMLGTKAEAMDDAYRFCFCSKHQKSCYSFSDAWNKSRSDG